MVKRGLTVISRDFKIQRRGRQREGQKNNWFNKQNNNFARSLNFIRLLRVVITPSVTWLLRGENDSKQSDEFQATSHVHHTFLYISFPFFHDYDVKMPYFAFYGGCKQARTNFNYSF